jgi:hypothetical protein
VSGSVGGHLCHLWTTLSSLDKTFVLLWGTYHVRFVLGDLSHCFNCSIPRVRFASYHHTREPLKRTRSCTLLSPQLSLSLTFTSQNLLAFVLYSISSLSYLPRTRTSAPRRSQTTLLYCSSCDVHDTRDLLDQLSLLE